MANVTFTIHAGKAFKPGQWVLAQSQSAPSAQIFGQVVSYVGTTLVIQPITTGGSGTHADWTIVLANSAAAAGFQPPIGTGNVTGPGSSTTGHIAAFADSTGRILQDGGANVPGASTVNASMLLQSAAAFGLNMLNGTIVPSVSGNALTLAIKTLAGNDPSATDPVWFAFRSATASSGAMTVIEVTAPLSTTVPAGSTLGFANGTPGRVWIVAVNNAGTVSLAVKQATTAAGGVLSTYPLVGEGLANIVAYGGGANSAQVFYGTSTLSSVPYCTLGFVTWEAGSTLATAGQWSAGPSITELYRPGRPLPGTVVQRAMISSAATTTPTGATFVTTALSLPMAPTSSANIFRAVASGYTTNQGSGAALGAQMQRGASTALGQPVQFGIAAASSPNEGAISLVAWDTPFTSSSITYAVYVQRAGGATNPVFAGGVLEVSEIQA